MTTDLKKADITAEEWREYEFVSTGKVYRIYNPVSLYTRPGGTTHRVVDADGVTHCVLAVGDGVVLRWKNRAGLEPVQF